MSFSGNLILIGFAVLSGCEKQQYEYSLDTFPPGSKPHENNYSHILQIRTTAKHNGDFCTIGSKQIQISVENADKENLYTAGFEANVGSVKRSVSWDGVAQIYIQLTHRSCKCVDSDCDYLEQGKFRNIVLKFNEESGKYVETQVDS